MNELPPTSPTPKLTRLRRFLRGAVLAILVLALVLVVFQRPLLRHAVDWAARHYSASAGLALDWKLDGSVSSDLVLRDVTISGSTDSVIKKITLHEVKADYSLWTLLRKGTGKFLGDLDVAGGDIEIDPRAVKASAETTPKKSDPLPDFWSKHMDLTNLNLRIKRDDGDIVLRNLTLLLDESKPGEIEIEELVLPAQNIHLTHVRGKTALNGRTIIITDLAVMPDVNVPRLVLGLHDLKYGKVSLELKAHSGDATIDGSGQLEQLTSNLSLDVSLTLNRLAHSDVGRWVKLPENVSWRVEQASLQIKGRPAAPQSLTTSISINGAAINMPGFNCDGLDLRAKSEGGTLNVETLTVRVGTNVLDASGIVMLPPTWSGFSRLTTDARYKFDLPNVETLVSNSQNLTGQLRGSGTMSMKDGSLVAAQTALEGTDLTLFHVSLAMLRADVTADAKAVRVNSLMIRLDEQNSAQITGQIDLDEKHTVKVAWNLELRNLGAAAQAFGAKDIPLPDAGTLTSNANAEFSIAELVTLDFQHVVGDATISLDNVVWQNARLDSLAFAISCHDGVAEVQRLEARLNERNFLSAKGRVPLSKTAEFTADISASFPQLADFSGWLELAKAPRITGGSADLAWNGHGKIPSHEIIGAGAIHISNLKFEGKPDTFSLALETRHDSHRAEITRLGLSAGKFRATATASISETDLDIPRLTVFSGELPLVEGSAKIPLALAAQPRPAVPIDANRPLQVMLRMEKIDFVKLFAVVGQKPPVIGSARADLDLHGTLSDPAGKISLALSDVRFDALKGKLEPAMLQLDGTLEKNRLSVEASILQKPLQKLTANAELPMDLEKSLENPGAFADTELTARITLPNSDLALMQKFLPGVANLKGTVGLDVQISGPVRAPQWQGTIHADAPSARLTQAQMDIKDMKAHISFSEHRITVDDVSAVLAGGQLRVQGTVDATQLKNPAIDLRLEAKEALIVRDDTMSLRADGSVTCKGTLEKSDVSGRVELVRGRIFKEIEFLPLSLPNGLPPRPPPGKITQTSYAFPQPFDKWNFNVDFATRDSIRLLGNVLNGGAAADLHLRGLGAKPEIEGKISLENARVRLPNSRLSITRGDIIFNKDKPLDPVIDLQGDSQVGGYFVTVYAYDRAVDPKLRFTSSPPLSEGEIATLLATGSASSDARTAGGAAANAAAFQVVSKLYRNLFNKNAPKRYDEEPPKLTLSFSPLSSDSSQRKNVSTAPNVSATYELSPHYQLKGGFGENGFRGMLYYLVRFR